MAYYHKHMAHYHNQVARDVLMVMNHELMVISHVLMLISHGCLFTNANEISLRVTMRDLPKVPNRILPPYNYCHHP